MPILKAKQANVYPKTHRSGNVTWQVCVGTKHDGRKDVRSFEIEQEARNFADKWNLSLVGKSNSPLADLNDITRHEVLAAVKKLEAYRATIPEAVNFFLTYSRPDKGQFTTEEAMKFFLQQKARKRCSAKYLDTCENTYLKPFAKAFPKRIVSEISYSEADKYIFTHSTWNATTTRSHISYLRTFYEFLKKKGYAKLNPFEHVEAPCKTAPQPKTLTALVLLSGKRRARRFQESTLPGWPFFSSFAHNSSASLTSRVKGLPNATAIALAVSILGLRFPSSSSPIAVW